MFSPFSGLWAAAPQKTEEAQHETEEAQHETEEAKKQENEQKRRRDTRLVQMDLFVQLVSE